MLRTAIRFLLYDKAKSIGAMAGVLLSVFLVGQQSGIFIFLTNAMGSLAINNPEYIWVIDNRTTNVNNLGQLDGRVGRELASIPGVRKVYPLVLAGGSAKFKNGKTSSVLMVGVQYPECAGGPWDLAEGSCADLLQDGAIITDYYDRTTLGNAKIGEYFEINGKQAFIAGNTKGVRSFGGTYVFTTIERARYLGNFPDTKASAFLVEWQPNANEEQVIANINASKINGIRAWNSEDLANSTILEVLASSGIAFSVGSLIIFVLISGFVIIGLTLYSSAIDRIRDYGTLKAIGAPNSYVRRLIFTQAFIVAVLGFAIGFALVQGFKRGIAQAGTIFEFPFWLQVGFLIVTLFIAFFGSLFAIRRVTSLEPSAVFRG